PSFVDKSGNFALPHLAVDSDGHREWGRKATVRDMTTPARDRVVCRKARIVKKPTAQAYRLGRGRLRERAPMNVPTDERILCRQGDDRICFLPGRGLGRRGRIVLPASDQHQKKKPFEMGLQAQLLVRVA